jgi:hypothetical protein
MKAKALFLFLPLLLMTRVAHAQPFGPEGERPFERIERFKKMRLIEMLDMKEEQSVRFFARLNEHDNAKRDLMKAKMDLLDKIDRLVRNHADAKEFESMFPDVAAANVKIFDEDQKFFNGLTDILTAEQRGKLLLFERHFEQELRDAMREVQKRRHRMGE